MAIRPPSLQHTYDEYYSGDDAFRQLRPEPAAAEAEDYARWCEERDEHHRQWRVARETGDVRPLLTDEQAQPTRFQLRPIPGDAYRKLIDMAISNTLGSQELDHLLFRLALVGVANLSEQTPRGPRTAKVETMRHPDFGVIARPDIANLLDSVDYRILAELSAAIRSRTEQLGPKSARG